MGRPLSCKALKCARPVVSDETETSKPSTDLDARYCRSITSRSYDSWLWAMITWYPLLYAIDSIPLMTCEKKVLAISHTTMPIERLLFSLRLNAIGFGR